METRFLQTFLTVVETASLAEAARRLNITPSAVVQRIRALEDEIGQPLIQRSGHSTQPTGAGAAILDDVRRMLAAANDVKAAASVDLETGLLRIGMIHTVLTGLLPDLLVALRQNRPGIELNILPGVSGELYSSVADGKLDAAILVKPHFALPKSMDWAPLRSEPLLLIAPAAVKGDDPRRILESEPFIRYDRNHWGGRVVDLYLRKLKLQLREQYELDSLEAIAILVSRGFGVSLIPDWLPPWPEATLVRRIEVARAPARDIGLLWSKSSVRPPLIRAFLAEAINACRLKERSEDGAAQARR